MRVIDTGLYDLCPESEELFAKALADGAVVYVYFDDIDSGVFYKMRGVPVGVYMGQEWVYPISTSVRETIEQEFIKGNPVIQIRETQEPGTIWSRLRGVDWNRMTSKGVAQLPDRQGLRLMSDPTARAAYVQKNREQIASRRGQDSSLH